MPGSSSVSLGRVTVVDDKEERNHGNTPTSNVVAACILVHGFLAFGAGLARLLDHVLRRFLVLPPPPVPLVILLAGLARMPGHYMASAVFCLASDALEPFAGGIVNLARPATGGQTPSEVGYRLDGGSCGESVVTVKVPLGGIAPDVAKLQERGAFGTLQPVPRRSFNA